MIEQTSQGLQLPELLLVEPDSVIRGTVAGVCKQLNLAIVHQAASINVAENTANPRSMDCMLVSLSEGNLAFRFLERVRTGEWGSSSEIPLAVTSDHANDDLIVRVKALAVKRLLLQPYKIKDVVKTIETLRQELQEDAS